MSSAHRLRLTAVVALAVLGVAACVAAAPGWTYTPAPPVTPAPSVVASGSAGGSSAPSGGAAPSGGSSGSPAASAGAGAVEISALNIAYEQATATAPAGKPFQIAFNNKDNGVPHNVSIHKDNASGAEVFKGEIVTGPATTTYDVPALDAGTYAFVCTVHPNMTGTLTVQ